MAEKKELSKNRQALLDKVVELFEGKKLDWTKGWSVEGQPLPPVSGVAGTRYRGINNVLLWLTAMERNYQDNRWVTFHQIEANGWSFKKDAEGNSLGKGAGVPVEMFRYYDKSTKKDLDWKAFLKLTLDEQKTYWDENVRSVARYYTVFNADIVEGMPPMQQQKHISAEEQHERAETIMRAWNDKQCPIIHDGGDRAYYSPKSDSVHLPERTSFSSLEDYYGTALHEIGHATGHASRLNRDQAGFFGSENYAKEELRAEFASMFMQQELGLPMSEYHIKNHTAYLQSWGESIKDEPNMLFDAVKDAGKITTYIFDNAASLEAKASIENTFASEALADTTLEKQAPAQQDKDFEKKMSKVKWSKEWITVDSVDGGYAETTYEYFDSIPTMNLMKSKKQDVWYIGSESPEKEPKNHKCVFFDENSARTAFDKVKEFQHSERSSSRSRYEAMSIPELQSWIEEHGHNPVTGKESVWLFNAKNAIEEKEKENQRIETAKSALYEMISSMPKEREIPPFSEQTASADSPFLRAMLGEDVNE